MTPAEIEQNDRHLRERKKFDDEKKQERNALEKKQIAELSQKGASQDLDKKHEQERIELQQKQAKEGQELYDRHQQEYANLHAIQKTVKSVKNSEREQEIKALNTRYAEERENTRRNTEAFQEKNKSLIEKLKDRWSKNKDNDRDR